MTSFTPHPLLPGGHLQTMAGVALRPASPLPVTRESVETPDGDFLDLDWLGAERRGQPIVLLLHGLAGSSRSGPMVSLMKALCGPGVRVAGLNLRGCSGRPNRRPCMYHGGKTDDLETVVSHLLSLPGRAPLVVAGYSLGGNLVLKWLGERGPSVPERVVAAAAISVPYDLGACARQLERGPLGRLYRWLLVRRLKARVLEMLRRHPGLLEERTVAGVRTFHDFDDRITAPLYGFDSAEDYWRRCSARGFLAGIRRPTLLVSARDDPFLAAEELPGAGVLEANPFLRADLPGSGGHLGFVGAGGELWLERRIGAYVGEALAQRPSASWASAASTSPRP